MSRIYATVNETYTKRYSSSITCDICTEKSRNPSDYEHSWAASQYEVQRTEVTLEEGSIDSDGGGSNTKTRFDICPTCFKNTLIPFLRNLGAEPEVNQIDH